MERINDMNIKKVPVQECTYTIEGLTEKEKKILRHIASFDISIPARFTVSSSSFDKGDVYDFLRALQRHLDDLT